MRLDIELCLRVRDATATSTPIPYKYYCTIVHSYCVSMVTVRARRVLGTGTDARWLAASCQRVRALAHCRCRGRVGRYMNVCRCSHMTTTSLYSRSYCKLLYIHMLCGVYCTVQSSTGEVKFIADAVHLV